MNYTINTTALEVAGGNAQISVAETLKSICNYEIRFFAELIIILFVGMVLIENTDYITQKIFPKTFHTHKIIRWLKQKIEFIVGAGIYCMVLVAWLSDMFMPVHKIIIGIFTGILIIDILIGLWKKIPYINLRELIKK